MSTSTASRITLADLISLISKANLTDRQKSDYRSAVKTAAKVIGADPDAIEADPARLRRRLEEVAPAAHGISAGRWANVRSLLGKALALARPMLPSRVVHPLLPGWQRLLEQLSRNKRDRLQALARYLSAQGIEPGCVKLSDLEAYFGAIMKDRLRSRPEKTRDAIIWVWNWCSREVAGWPALEFPRQSRRKTYVLPWSAFPPSLKEDVDRFLLRQSGKDLSEDGPPRPLRETSLKTREYQLRVAASILVELGDAPDAITSISILVSVDNYKRILGVLIDRAGGVKSSQVFYIADFLRSVAKHWVKVDELTLERLKRIASNGRPRSGGMIAKNRERLRPFNDEATVDRFQELPVRIRADVEKSKLPARRKALLAQMSAAIAILLVVPMRRKNLASLDIERHLIERGGVLYVTVPEHEVKNQQFIDFEFPPDIADIVAWYVRVHRPALLTTPSTALFPGKAGKPKALATFGAQISKIVYRYTGLKANPHLFRHLAAKLYLDRHPGDYVTVQRVLGHKSLVTTTSTYTGMETRAAGRHFVDVVRGRLNNDLPATGQQVRLRRARR